MGHVYALAFDLSMAGIGFWVHWCIICPGYAVLLAGVELGAVIGHSGATMGNFVLSSAYTFFLYSCK